MANFNYREYRLKPQKSSTISFRDILLVVLFGFFALQNVPTLFGYKSFDLNQIRLLLMPETTQYGSASGVTETNQNNSQLGLANIGIASKPKASYYSNCSAAFADNAAPIYRHEAAYRSEMGGDNDGIACEPYY